MGLLSRVQDDILAQAFHRIFGPHGATLPLFLFDFYVLSAESEIIRGKDTSIEIIDLITLLSSFMPHVAFRLLLCEY